MTTLLFRLPPMCDCKKIINLNFCLISEHVLLEEYGDARPQ